jgi:hypothetical protein
MRFASSVTCIMALHMMASPARSGQNLVGTLHAGGCRGFRDAKVRGTASILNQWRLGRGLQVTPPPFGLQLRGGGGAEEGEDGGGGEGSVGDVDMGEATARDWGLPPGGQGGGRRAVDVQTAGSQPGVANPQGRARKFAEVFKGDLDGDEYVEMMAVCAEEVGQGRGDIPDGYAIVEEAREAGRNVTRERIFQREIHPPHAKEALRPNLLMPPCRSGAAERASQGVRRGRQVGPCRDEGRGACL